MTTLFHLRHQQVLLQKEIKRREELLVRKRKDLKVVEARIKEETDRRE